MAKPNKQLSHPLYRLSLHLYPKSYQREYGDQMVQTLEDLLEEATTSLDRTAVWLRVIAETPLSVIRENVNNIGEGNVSKFMKISNKRLVIGGVSLAILVMGFAIGVERNSIVSGVADILYANPIRSLTIKQNNTLANPFGRFGGHTPKPTKQCSVGPTSGIKMQIACGATSQAYTKLGQSTADKARVLSSVAAVTAALQAAGYHSGSNGVTLSSLVTGTYAGKDYSPDAFYEKVIGKDVCVFDTTIAYSNPAQPAINMNLSCSRIWDMFGKPYQGPAYYSTYPLQVLPAKSAN